MRKICAKMLLEKPFSVNRFLASKNIPVTPQSTYSPDLSPCDSFLFPKLKNHLKGHHFGTSFWDTGKHSNGCNQSVEDYSNIRVPPVL
ncbi:hypothetical protein TNCV_67411 [Trichonephila clavipes]|nr:hypothetical protein TNCV_67411 [Trichonephila clavipes]